MSQTGVQTNSAQPAIWLNPQFIFGVKGDVKNNLFFLDDLRVLFPAGHNIVIHNTDDKK